MQELSKSTFLYPLSIWKQTIEYLNEHESTRVTNSVLEYFKEIFFIYGGYLEMPQKAFEGGILHVIAYAIFPEMPQNRTHSFSVLFSF